MLKAGTIRTTVGNALRDCRRAFGGVALLSAAVNLLMLGGPLYMLQVYDRVLTSRSVPTLVALTLILITAFAFQGALDLIRSRIVVRGAALLDQALGVEVYRAVLRLGIVTRAPGDALQPVRDLDQIRSFMTSAGPVAIVDLPWMPLFLGICFLLHPWLGFLSLAGAVLLLAMTVMTERASRTPARELAREAGARSGAIESNRRNAESIVAMGMSPALAERWTSLNRRYVGSIEGLADVSGGYGSITKMLRMLLQSAILGLGAYLVLRQELTAGAMIAASIMMGRALAPVETAIANWRSFIAARQSIRRLSETLDRLRAVSQSTALPKPQRSLDVENLAVAAPGAQKPVLQDIRFRLLAGDVLGIIGPSGVGKTSLVRTLTGIWRPARGGVRLDGATIDQWAPEVLGQSIGFVSQTADLFEGTIAENIARMAVNPDSATVIKAAVAAGAHDMILRLPAGYDTPIGDAGVALSAGQRQRIALARALFGAPFLLVLDEPHSNLDGEGEAALTQAILEAKASGAIVVMIAHRPSALVACDKLLVLGNGGQQAFGPRDEVLKKTTRAAHPPSGGNVLKIVSDGEHDK